MYTPFIILLAVFMWMGFICSISFMEAWLKFRAPGVTPSIGLGIGRLVFNALNKVECFFALIILIFLLADSNLRNPTNLGWFGISLLILLMQTFWLLPVLDKRASAKINGEHPAPSAFHWYFVVAECMKLISLFFLGKSFFDSLISFQQ